MENPEKNGSKYSLLASFLDKRLDMQSCKPEQPKDETDKKLLFVWDECNPPETDTGRIWEKVSQKIRNNDRIITAVTHSAGRRIRIRRILSGVAAVIVLTIGIAGFLFWQGKDTKEPPISQLLLADVYPEDIQEVTLIVSENEHIEIDEHSKIVYSPTGQISICRKTAEANSPGNHAAVSSVAPKDIYNQIIVPKGKRIQLVLSDSSRMWVNAESKVLYPRMFDAEKREIYVEGEVYLEVTPNALSPFTVHTERLSVEVLGTAFDVRAYKDCNDAVVLIDGKVRVKGTTLAPNERIEIDSEGVTKLERVNVHDYIYWINNVWKLDGQPLKQVLDMLSDYFGEEISCTPGIADEPVYGKLYLHNDVNQLITVITQTLQETIDLKNDSIYR